MFRALPLKLKVTSQGCADAGVCYPPQTQAVSLELPDPASTPSINAAPAAGEGDESGRIAAALKDAGFWANLAFFFLAGLGLSLTPCVFPMIPILSGIIAGQGHKVARPGFCAVADLRAGHGGHLRGRRVAAGMTGTLLAAALQSPWVLGGFALVFVVLSFSMFGFYELQLPSSLQSKLSDEAGHLQGGRGIGVFLMGACRR
jgi:thiol:disulfide interchange protein DsbD